MIINSYILHNGLYDSVPTFCQDYIDKTHCQRIISKRSHYHYYQIPQSCCIALRLSYSVYCIYHYRSQCFKRYSTQFGMPLYIILLPSNFLASIEDILNSHIVLAHITSKVILEVEALLTTMRPILTSKHNIIIKNDTVMLPLLGCRLIFGSYVMGLEFTSTHLLLSGNPYRNLITVII